MSNTVLEQLNVQFIEAFRTGSWPLLEPILAPSFRYLDGATGEPWDLDRYRGNLRRNPQPTIGVDQVSIHVAGDVATVSARSFTRPDRLNRYIDTYIRRPGGWACVHACVWPLPFVLGGPLPPSSAGTATSLSPSPVTP